MMEEQEKTALLNEEELQEVMEMELDPLETRSPESSGPTSTNLDFILDIPMEVSVELGRSKMLISDLLQLGQGSVIELTKLAGEPLEVLVNQKLIARGEVVVVNEKFGIRLTDIISPTERVKRLG
jgi:flagellar motor switch protein FliN/FliY